MKCNKAFLFVFSFLLILACIFHRECFFIEAGIGTFDDEYWGFVLPRISFIKANYLSGVSSLWNPFILTGTPFVSHPETQFFYLPRGLSYLLLSPEISDRAFFLSHLLLISLGIFLYVKLMTKSSSGALLAASLSIVCGPTTVMVASGNEMTLPMLAWWPFILWATEEFVRTERKKYLLIIMIALWFSILAQQLQIFAFMVIFYLFYLTIVAKHIAAEKRFAVMRELYISCLAAFLLSSVQLLPTLELASLSNRLRSYDVANSDPLQLYSFLSLIFPPVICFSKDNAQGFVVYFGFMSLLLAFWSIKSGIRMFLCGIFSLAMVLMALGLPLYWLFYKFFPFGKYMNGGEELTFALALFVPIMVGVGWSSLSFPEKFKWVKYIVFVIILAECVGWGESYYKNVRRVINQKTYLTVEKQIAGLIKSKDPLGRFLKYGDTSQIFTDNRSMEYRIFGIGGFYNFTYKKYSDLLSAVEEGMVGESGVYGESPDVRAVRSRGNLSLPVFDMMNVRYILSLDDLQGEQYQLALDRGIKVYENKKCLPRAFLIDHYEVIRDEQAMIQKITDPEFKPDQTLYLYKKPKWLQGNEFMDGSFHSNANIIKYEPDRIILSTTAPHNSLLFISDMFYPGWQARVDGRSTEVYEANVAFRAIPVPAGKHLVTLYYFPSSFKLGIILSMVGCALTFYQLRRKGFGDT